MDARLLVPPMPPPPPSLRLEVSPGTASKAPPLRPPSCLTWPPPPPHPAAAEKLEDLAECIKELQDLEDERNSLELKLVREGRGRYVDYPEWEYLKRLGELVYEQVRDTQVEQRCLALSLEEKQRLSHLLQHQRSLQMMRGDI